MTEHVEEGERDVRVSRVLAGWGVLLALDAWNVYFRRPLTEKDIDQELRHQRST
jgi:hypothetical protein